MIEKINMLSDSKNERYELAVIRYILKYLGVRQSVPDDPGAMWLKDEVPEWNFGPAVHSFRLEHNWIDFFTKVHPVEALLKEHSNKGEEAIIVFQWVPEKFMVMTEKEFAAPCVITKKGFFVYRLQDYLEYYFPNDDA